MKSNQSQRRFVPFTFLAVVVLAIAAGLWWAANRTGEDSSTPAADDKSALQTVRVALAATEDLDGDAADEAWSRLRKMRPDDVAVTRNWALNRLLIVDRLAEQTENRSLSADQRQAARTALPDRIAEANAAVEAFGSVQPDGNVLTRWMKARVDVRQAALLPAAIARGATRRVFDDLADFVLEHPDKDTVILAGTIWDLVNRMGIIEDLPADLRDKAADVLTQLAESNPDNLFVAVQAAQLNLAAQRPAAAPAIENAARLAKAIQPEMKARAGGAIESIDGLVAQMLDDIAQQDWQAANRGFGIWFNLVNASELMKADRRRASPHPLDRISFETIRQLSIEAENESPVQALDSTLSFRHVVIDDSTDTRLVIPVDLNVDLRPDLVSVSDQNEITLWRQSNGGDFERIADGPAGIKVTGMMATDLFMVDRAAPDKVKVLPPADPDATATPDFSVGLRHNVVPTLVVYGDEGIRLFGMDGRDTTADDRRLFAVDAATGLEDVRNVVKVVAGDLEGDGDLDLVVATRNEGLRLFINRGTRRFFEVEAPATGTMVDLAIVDIDRDLDLDIVAVEEGSGTIGLLENLLHLQFRYRVLSGAPAMPDAQRVFVDDVDGNVSWDLVVSGKTGGQIVWSQTADAGMWTVDSVSKNDGPMINGLLVDFDNDSFGELMHATEDGSLKCTHLTSEGFGATRAVQGDDMVVDVWHAADFDNNGRIDRCGVDRRGIVLGMNTTENDAHYLQVRMKGIDDNNAASGRVNHYAIGSTLELRFGPHYRSKVITSPMTHFGLDGIDQADSLRIIFPNGLTQTTRSPAVDTLVEEEQTLKGSCPYLYAWDGETFAFVTDCLWAAPLGLQVAAGVVAKDRPWEYLKVDGRFVAEKDGRYHLRLTEELWEIAYFDHVALTAVDHPSGVQIETNEKVGPPSIAQPTIYAFDQTDMQPAAAARDTGGNDVADRLADVDGRYVQGFDRRIVQGLCPPHWIELTVPDAALQRRDAGEAVYMVLTGWILPTDTSLNIQIDQNDEMPPIEFPGVWVPDGDAGETKMPGWRPAIASMGFPGGKTKTIVVDVTDALVPEDPRLRIRTSAQIYWDAAKFTSRRGDDALVVHKLTMETAEVGYRGFSRRIRASLQQPETYDYHTADADPRWPPLRGSLTGYGDVSDMLARWDDKMVVISGGDEIRLTFKVPETPVPDGYVRDFVLHCVGWDKDADLNTLAGQSADPLPFRHMKSYPPTVADQDAAAQVMRSHTASRSRRQSFRRFWHRP
ncbi:FG-GAP-like repeat-containing protein [Crateriforma conspicua]|uniref:ASPIC/UnbV domain-containing protein n=1 Tax=Crateriforma conspicua TaxID=2527996 RepID=A0A5C6G056_9PLAN|nr:FG-GAP-like repeat-containing protein [Crateriforma conspicua]TWU66633.1 hypothetical protein V7x_22030 [Crateriforma conspicua]